MLEYNKKPSKSKKKNANDYIEELSKAGRVYDTINDNKAKFIKIDENLLTFEIVNLDKPFQMKELNGIDKIIKKDFKFINSLSCDSKYFTRLFCYNIIYSR